MFNKQMYRKIATAFLSVAIFTLAQAGVFAEAATTGLKEATSSDTTLVITGENLALPADALGNKAVIFAKDGGMINMTGGSLTSVSDTESVGAATAEAGGAIKLTDVSILTDMNESGNKNFGLDASSGGVIEMTGGSVTTRQYDSYGARSINGGAIDLDNVAIETYGEKAYGVYAGGGRLDVTGGGITLHGAGGNSNLNMAALAEGGANMTLTDTKVLTTSNYALGAYAYEKNTTMDINGTRVDTKGHYSHGLFSSTGAAMHAEGSAIVTEGAGAYGVYSLDGATLGLKDTDVVTKGGRAYGMMAWGSSLSMENGSVHTSQTGSFGAVSLAHNGTGASMTLKSVDITTEGGAAHGVRADKGGLVTMQAGGSVQVNDATSYALFTAGSGSVDAQDGIYRISGDVFNTGTGAIGVSYLGGSLFTGVTSITNSGTIDYKMSGDARWNMTGDSLLTSLAMSGTNTSGPLVDMTRDGDTFSTLTVGALSGAGGTFLMNTDIAAETADKVLVYCGTDGSHTLDVVDSGSAATTGDERTILVETADRNGNFTLANGTVDAGAWKYALRSVSNDERGQLYSCGGDAGQLWELYAQGPSGPGEGGIDSFIGTYFLNYAETDTLIKRLGDLRGNSEHGAWFRGFGGKMSSNARDFAGDFDMDYWGMQVGYDNKLDRDKSWLKNGDTYVGAFIGTSKGDVDFGRNGGTGDLEHRTVGMYATYIGDKGYYVDAIAKYVWSRNEYTAYDSAGAQVTSGRVNSGGAGLSLETGKRIRFNNENKKGHWYVEPQAQLSWQHFRGDTFHASNGLDIGVDSFNSLIGRAGVLVGYEGKNTNIYAKASYLKEFDGDMSIHANGTNLSSSLDDDWIVYGVGITRQMNDRHSLYLDLERADGGDFDKDWNINAGWRISF